MLSFLFFLFFLIDSGKETEQFYLKKKYEVINKLNAAMRRQAQLTIL